jgi:hypothetical protein
VKLAIARLLLWLFVSIVLFQTLLGALAVAIGVLFVVYKRALAHFCSTTTSREIR